MILKRWAYTSATRAGIFVLYMGENSAFESYCLEESWQKLRPQRKRSITAT